MLPPPSSFCISFTDKVRLSAYRQLFLLPDLQPPSITQKSERKKKATGVGSLHLSFPFHSKVRQYLSVQGRTHDLHKVQHEKEAFLPLRSMTGGKKTAVWQFGSTLEYKTCQGTLVHHITHVPLCCLALSGDDAVQLCGEV